MAPRQDRLIFDTHVLPNGITVYHKPMDVPFAMMRIIVPVGHVHNTSDIPNGSAHFLEHMVCKRCTLYPAEGSFEDRINMSGGESNAYTTPTFTAYETNVPSTLFEEGFRALFSRVFEPILDESGIAHERSIISSERRRASKWYPVDNDLVHYVGTHWMEQERLAIEQVLGGEADLQTIDVPTLEHLHRHYFSQETKILIGGTCDIGLAVRELEKLPTNKDALPAVYPPFRWGRKGYHEKAFDDEHRFTIHRGGLLPRKDIRTLVATRCLHDLLVDPTSGALYNWLRNEKGWSYGLPFHVNKGIQVRGPAFMVLALPLNEKKQVSIVRAELDQRIEAALDDRDLIAAVLRRFILGSVFQFQRLADVFHFAEEMLTSLATVPTEAELLQQLESLEDGEYLREMYRTAWTKDAVGEFLSTPLTGK